MFFASTSRHFLLVSLAIVSSIWHSQLQAGTLMYISDPLSSSQSRAYDIILERPENIEKLLPAISNLGAQGERTVETFVCEEAGWFAAAHGDTGEFGGEESVGLFCGASSQKEAEYGAMRRCDERRFTSQITCELEYVKYDSGNISFLQSYEIIDLETGTFQTRGSGYAYGGEHGKYNGIAPTPPAEEASAVTAVEAASSGAAQPAASASSTPVATKTSQAAEECKSSLEKVMEPGKTQCSITHKVMSDRAISSYSGPEDAAKRDAAQQEADAKFDTCLETWQARLDKALLSCN